MTSWFGNRSGSTGNALSVTSVQKQRLKQIELLRELVSNVTELRRDELYQVTFTVHGNPITLEIKLPPNFPLTDHCPVVTVSPPMRHSWINEYMIVDGSPLVQNFTIHSNLGRAVQQIIKEFCDHPPEIVTSQPPQPPTESNMVYVPPSLGGIFTPYMYSSEPRPVVASEGTTGTTALTRRQHPPLPSTGSGRLSSYQPPSLPDRLEDIRQMSTEELERYLEEDEGAVLVDQYVAQMDVITKVQQDRHELFADNGDQAGINLRHEPDLQESWALLQDKFLQIEALQTEHDKLLDEQRQLTDRYQRRNVVTWLKTRIQEIDTDSEIVAEDFMDKKLTLSEFEPKYKQQRTLYHMRKSKHEKLTHSTS